MSIALASYVFVSSKAFAWDFFPSARANKSNQQESNAPLDTEHIKSISSSDFSVVWDVRLAESIAQQTAKAYKREMKKEYFIRKPGLRFFSGANLNKIALHHKLWLAKA